MQHPMPEDWVVVDHISTLYEHIPSGRHFRAPFRVVVRSVSSNIVYDKFGLQVLRAGCLRFQITNCVRRTPD